jgi:hypothetical protein
MAVTDVWHATSKMIAAKACSTDTFTTVKKKTTLGPNAFSTYYSTGF